MKVKKLIVALVVILFISLFNVVNAFMINPRQLTIREEVIKSDKIDASFDGYIIAYFGDLNYHGETDNKKLDLIVKKINDINPDVVIFGGDLIYEKNVETSYLQDKLADITSKNSKYAILGESDTEFEENILINSEFKILDGNNIQLYRENGSFINLVGVGNSGNVSSAFEGIGSGYNLVVSHMPDNASNIVAGDYILASHSLGGRCYIPLFSSFKTIDGAHKYYHGKHNVNGATLDITNGVNTKEKSTRFLADAEIVFYKIEAN